MPPFGSAPVALRSSFLLLVAALALAATGCTGRPDGDDDCFDGRRDGAETDVDCGGGCLPCAVGLTCALAADCGSGVCDSTCQAPTCADGVKNGAETGPDCGGTCPAACLDGQHCLVHADCRSRSCAGGLCVPASCSDGILNGSESDVDCGGACAPCAPTKACAAAGDCTSLVCTLHVCQAAVCGDGVKNGDETDLDCGGSCGATCAAGRACAAVFDCASGVCDPALHACKAPSCADHVRNGDETDLDCGGACGATCAEGKACGKAGDCVTNACDAGTHVCVVGSSCSDGVQNGDETDTDCGGSCGATCGYGQRCVSDWDCYYNYCDYDGTCI